ncbi:hypothetical protein HUU05_20635 [candidate division KSB1 bacterium]|nr:hypothetical protein [candidate division KSB1 bacterium]
MITLTSEIGQEKVLPVLQHSIEREIVYLSIGLRKTQQRLEAFRKEYGLRSSSEAKSISPLDKLEWEGEEITLSKLEEKIQILKSITLS